ncbi:MAG: 16S rRNA (guanine(966)-N(2))-methyltransferase RsmD [Burkholderiales bacterium]
MTLHRVRIIGGEWRSRIVSFPPHEGLRPTPDRVRETLFNWLGQDLAGQSCLDLFAGSGVLGFEAISRGAAQAVLVDKERDVFKALQQSAKKLDADRILVVCSDALSYLRREKTKFDVIFFDPPYGSVVFDDYLPLLGVRMSDDAVVYFESNRAITLARGWRAIRQKRAGQVHFALARRVAKPALGSAV